MDPERVDVYFLWWGYSSDRYISFKVATGFRRSRAPTNTHSAGDFQPVWNVLYCQIGSFPQVDFYDPGTPNWIFILPWVFQCLGRTQLVGVGWGFGSQRWQNTSITLQSITYPTIGEFTLKRGRVLLNGCGLSSLFFSVFMNDFHMDFWVQLLWSDFFPDPNKAKLQEQWQQEKIDEEERRKAWDAELWGQKASIKHTRFFGAWTCIRLEDDYISFLVKVLLNRSYMFLWRGRVSFFWGFPKYPAHASRVAILRTLTPLRVQTLPAGRVQSLIHRSVWKKGRGVLGSSRKTVTEMSHTQIPMLAVPFSCDWSSLLSTFRKVHWTNGIQNCHFRLTLWCKYLLYTIHMFPRLLGIYVLSENIGNILISF